MSLQLEQTLAQQLPDLCVDFQPSGFEKPELLFFDQELAEELEATELEEKAAAWCSGNVLLEGSRPVALAYAGHQFGGFSPQLGDGRAVLLGELRGPGGRLFDLQLKGSGPTVFSRGGDGKATLGPILRETLVSRAMHRLGVPTSRVLAAATTGEAVPREKLLPGAVLCRVAASHLRIGTAEFLAARGRHAALGDLVAYALERHYPEAVGAEHPARRLLGAVANSQAELIARWMQIGFVHGVMNTDNVTLSGETIDYGPCAFMESYDEHAVFSSIDHGGRYAYGNQPLIGRWNLARLGEALLPLLSDDPKQAVTLVHEAIEAFDTTYEARLLSGFRTKLGLPGDRENDVELIQSYLDFLGESNADFTRSFRSLAEDLRSFGEPQWGPMGQELAERYTSRLEGKSPQDVATEMDAVNPIYIPRNHLVERVLGAAHAGNMDPFLALMRVLDSPFERNSSWDEYAEPAPEDFGPYRTFCGT